MVLIVGLGNPGSKYERTRHNVGFMVVDALLKKLGQVKESVWIEEKRFLGMVAKIKEQGSKRAGEQEGGTQSGGVKERESKRGKDGEIVLLKPQTFMNASGTSVAKLMNFYKINPMALYVIHDEIDLPLGKIKIVIDRGAAGHHGVESIINAIGGKNFVRIRVGIGHEGERGGKWDKGREVGSGINDEGGLVRIIKGVKKIWGGTGKRAAEGFVLQSFQKNEEGKLNNVIKKSVEVMEIILEEGVERAMGRYN